jgi:hypothetical protein
LAGVPDPARLASAAAATPKASRVSVGDKYIKISKDNE